MLNFWAKDKTNFYVLEKVCGHKRKAVDDLHGNLFFFKSKKHLLGSFFYLKQKPQDIGYKEQSDKVQLVSIVNIYADSPYLCAHTSTTAPNSFQL